MMDNIKVASLFPNEKAVGNKQFSSVTNWNLHKWRQDIDNLTISLYE